MNYYIQALKKYATFTGRARRKEYLTYLLVYYCMLLVPGITLNFVEQGGTSSLVLGILSIIIILFHAIPGLAVSVRRLHDTGRSGWWLLINFILVIGNIAYIVFCLSDSDPKANEYGPSPKAAQSKKK